MGLIFVVTHQGYPGLSFDFTLTLKPCLPRMAVASSSARGDSGETPSAAYAELSSVMADSSKERSSGGI